MTGAEPEALSFEYASGYFFSEIFRFLDEGSCDYYGARTVEDLRNHETGEPLRAGDRVPRSRVWEDLEPTDETLDGVAATEICPDAVDEEDVWRNSLRHQFAWRPGDAGYFGEHVMLLGSYSASEGNDWGEIVMRDAVVLGVYARADVVVEMRAGEDPADRARDRLAGE